MKSLILDSYAIIDLFDGDDDIRETISSAEKVLVPAAAFSFDATPKAVACAATVCESGRAETSLGP